VRASEAVDVEQARDELGAEPAPAEPAPAEPVVDAASTPRRESSQRLANVERLRILAMLEIVTFHVGGAIDQLDYRLPIIGGLGLPVFLLLNSAFNTTLTQRMGTRTFLDVKVARLVFPWVIWCCVYAGLVLAARLRHHEPLSETFSPWMLIGGTYAHLWFVPFALFGSLLIAGVQARTKAVSHRWMAGLALVAGAGVVLIDDWISRSRSLPLPLPQWLFALPSPLLGFALGRVLISADRALLRKLASALMAIAGLAIVLSWFGEVPAMAYRYSVSMALVSGSFLWPGGADGLSRRLTPLLFGVYLAHPLLVRLYQGVHLPLLPTALLGAVIFAASALLVEGLRRSPLRRLV
jgi:surface polysaccharide O-acyltransferase-like enzyme